jgi:hypothetical protein
MSANSLPRLAIIGCGAVVDYHLLPALKRQGWLPSVLNNPGASANVPLTQFKPTNLAEDMAARPERVR